MNRRGWLLVVGVAVLLAGAAGGGWLLWRRWHEPDQPRLTAAQRLELLETKNVALGLLENARYGEAIPLLDAIVTALPDDPLGHRNRTIALLAPTDEGDLTLGLRPDDDRAARADKVERVLAAVQRLLQVEGRDSAPAHFLAGRAFHQRAEMTRGSDPAAFQDALTRAREHYREAARLSPQDPAPLYFLFALESLAEPHGAAAAEALRSAYVRVPDNLVCLIERLVVLAERGDPEVRSVLERALRLLPDGPAGQPDPRKFLGEALQLLEQNPGKVPPQVAGLLRRAYGGFQRTPAYQQARRQVKPHPLEYMLQDFQPAFYEGLPPDAEPTVAVRFQRFRPADVPAGDDLLAIAAEELNSDDGVYFPYTLLLRRGAEGVRVECVPAKAGVPFEPVELPGRYTALQLADLDLDIKPPPEGTRDNLPADLDLIVSGPDGLRLLENRGEHGRRRWVDRTADAKLPDLAGLVWLLVCDLDHDGNLDLVAGLPQGVRVLRNRGDWLFDDISSRSEGLEKLATSAGVYGDFDRDGDLDFLLADPAGKAILLDNQRSGRFTVRAAGELPARTMHLLAFDANNDGRLDLLASHADGATLFYAEDDKAPPAGARTFVRLTPGAPVTQAGAFDYDNDGRLDLWLLTDGERPLRLFHNRPGGLFPDASELLPAVADPPRSVVPADVDGDGDLDLLLAGPNGVEVLRNDGGNQNHWLSLRLRALPAREAAGEGQAAKCNYFNIGGTVELKAGRHYVYRQVRGPTTHLGLGPRTRADLLRVVWTNGVPQAVIRPQADQTLSEEQMAKGSCPFLFAWDGTRFVFVTDCLWSSALGMQLAHGVFMDHRRQENHLVIPPEKLRPKDGEYVLQFTNELWEVPYLDQAELWAVDHPPDVEVCTNQRVPPNTAEPFHLLTVRQRRPPLAARDHRGRDVLDIIRRRDGRYLGGFTRLRYVGLAEPHWLELDLGDLRGAKEATLFLTGWVWPTDTSANVAISQDPRFRGGPQVIGGSSPPALLVPDGRGGWVTAAPCVGFPAGKLQTVAVPLPLDRLPPGDGRVRLATSMELYWDEVFFTVDEPRAAVEVARLPVAAADLHYRGYSRISQASPTSPHLYDYDDVDPRPRWLPIRGRYTRYGDVTELLHQPDSRYVIMGTGDELTLRFPAPPPAAGRTRSFIFYANGWLKDFDLNGAASDQIGPLPFDGMSRYPYCEPEQYPTTAEHERFQKTYLTRTEDWEAFWDALKPAENRRGRRP